MSEVDKLKQKIAELEAERDNAWRQFKARMDEVMAERDRLKAENAELEAEITHLKTIIEGAMEDKVASAIRALNKP